MAENNQMTASTSINTNTWSDKKMEGDNGFGMNTLESLRGRLLAERQASRAAKEEAHSLGNKFVELEKQLRQETKLRDKAQRKLQFLKKKLESLNISNSTHSESNETKPHTTNPTLSESAMHSQSVEEASEFIQIHSSEKLRNDESRLSSLSPKTSLIENEEDHEDFVDNSLALVPVTFPVKSQATNNHKPLHENVLQVLDALKRSREGLICSVGTRPMIKVGQTIH